MVEISMGFGLVGRAMLETLRTLSQERLGVNNALSVRIPDFLNGEKNAKIADVYDALFQLPKETQEELLSEAHRRMCLDGSRLLSQWPRRARERWHSRGRPDPTLTQVCCVPFMICVTNACRA